MLNLINLLLEINMSDDFDRGTSGTLKNGSDFYIPVWPCDVALQNLATASKMLGMERLVTIAVDKDVQQLLVGIALAASPKALTSMVFHYVGACRVDGMKLESVDAITNEYDGRLEVVMEIFVEVLHAQYARFFELGLAKENSPETSETEKTDTK